MKITKSIPSRKSITSPRLTDFASTSSRYRIVSLYPLKYRIDCVNAKKAAI